MIRNAFGEPQIQPDDSFDDVWIEWMDEAPEKPMARFLEHDEVMGWGCEITAEGSDAITTRDFPSREALVEWLESSNIEIEDDA